MQKKIAVLGATGSVGLGALDVARERGYKVELISANSNEELAERVAREFKPKALAMANERAAASLKVRLADTDIKIYSGDKGIEDSIYETEFDVAVNSILGKAGLIPSLSVIKKGRRLALANKESLVVAGEIVMGEASRRGVEIIPVDSEHSAIFQSLKSGKREEIKRILLTASGGPFFGKSREELKFVTLSDALAHPTWKMGRKITVDSATLMNKGFEIIEAAHLFGVGADKIKVLVHRESILHSAVEYIDNSVIGEFSVPDMRMCVQYAVDYPERIRGGAEELDLVKIGKLTFAEPDEAAFPLLALAKRALSEGGAMGAVLNAADEIAADAFLNERITFTEIFDVVSYTFEKMLGAKSVTSLEEILYADKCARELASAYVEEIRSWVQ